MYTKITAYTDKSEFVEVYQMGYKIKQQKQIQRFLTEEFGEEKVNLLFEKESEMLNTIIKQTTGKTKNQLKTLVQTILPRIAMYKTFWNDGFCKDETNRYMRKYMLEIIAARKHSSTAKMEKFPGFYHIYSRVFLKIMRY